MANGTQRDRDATEAKLMAAVEELILDGGFGAVGINAVARRAGVDKVLIYRYFGGLPGLLAAYGENGDFWWQVDDILREPLPDPNQPEGLSAALTVVFERHAAFLRGHPVTLEVIAWEMSDRNALTEALEMVREMRSIAMMRRLAERFAVDESILLGRVGPALALLGAAANYLAARGRRLRVFVGLDLQTDQGWATLCDAGSAMIAGTVQTLAGGASGQPSDVVTARPGRSRLPPKEASS